MSFASSGTAVEVASSICRVVSTGLSRRRRDPTARASIPVPALRFPQPVASVIPMTPTTVRFPTECAFPHIRAEDKGKHATLRRRAGPASRAERARNLSLLIDQGAFESALTTTGSFPSFPGFLQVHRWPQASARRRGRRGSIEAAVVGPRAVPLTPEGAGQTVRESRSLTRERGHWHSFRSRVKLGTGGVHAGYLRQPPTCRLAGLGLA